MEFLRKDAFILGFIVALIVPVVAYGLLLTIYDFLDAQHIISDAGMAGDFRTRTLGLFAICCNLIPLTIYRRMHNDNTMRGMVFPTMLYVGAWFYFYGRHLVNL